MVFRFDPEKDAVNQSKHGLSLSLAESFDMDTAFFTADTSQYYGEERVVAIGWLGGELHTLVFTEREDHLRAISLRKSISSERRTYADEY